MKYVCALKCCFFSTNDNNTKTVGWTSTADTFIWISLDFFLYFHNVMYFIIKKSRHTVYIILFLCDVWLKKRGIRQTNKNRERECEETCVMMTVAITHNLFDQYSNNQNKNLKCFINFYREFFTVEFFFEE